MTLIIEKGIPIPEKKHEQLGLAELVRSMVIGDSVLIPSKRTYLGGRVFQRAGKDRKFTQRVAEDGLRIWRID